MIPSRWEHGSEFYWVDPPAPDDDDARDALLQHEPRRFANGRAAMIAVVRTCGAGRLWVPSYFCPEVVEALEAVVPIALYPDAPEPGTAPELPPARPGDAVLLVNTFAFRQQPEFVAPPGVTLIEDHTHDPIAPWALGSRAHYCVASLRKTLPLPDGGIAWSPTGAPLPSEPALRDEPDARKLTSMVLKRMYLDGHTIEKDAFRSLAIAGESALGSEVAMSRLSAELWPRLPLSRWRRTRGENFAAFESALGSRDGVRLLPGAEDAKPPFSAMLEFDTPARRSDVRAALIGARIYPAILWDLSDVPERDGLRPEDRERSRALLSVHCDMRYSTDDMQRVAECILGATSVR